MKAKKERRGKKQSGLRPSFNGDSMSYFTVHLPSSRPKKSYNSSTSTPKHQKIVMSPKAQGLVSNTHHGEKHMLKNCTHDRMSGGKAAKRSNSGATAKKTTFSYETNHAAVSLTPREDDSSRFVSTLAPQMPHHNSHSNENGVLCNDHYRQRTK